MRLTFTVLRPRRIKGDTSLGKQLPHPPRSPIHCLSSCSLVSESFFHQLIAYEGNHISFWRNCINVFWYICPYQDNFKTKKLWEAVCSSCGHFRKWSYASEWGSEKSCRASRQMFPSLFSPTNLYTQIGTLLVFRGNSLCLLSGKVPAHKGGDTSSMVTRQGLVMQHCVLLWFSRLWWLQWLTSFLTESDNLMKHLNSGQFFFFNFRSESVKTTSSTKSLHRITW